MGFAKFTHHYRSVNEISSFFPCYTSLDSFQSRVLKGSISFCSVYTSKSLWLHFSLFCFRFPPQLDTCGTVFIKQFCMFFLVTIPILLRLSSPSTLWQYILYRFFTDSYFIMLFLATTKNSEEIYSIFLGRH